MMVHYVNTINNTRKRYKGVPREDEDSKEEAKDEDEHTNRSLEDTKEKVEGVTVSLKGGAELLSPEIVSLYKQFLCGVENDLLLKSPPPLYRERKGKHSF